MAREPKTPPKICLFIRKWSDWFYKHTESFDGALGRQLAYLWPAVVKGEQIEVTPQSAIVRLLRRHNIQDDDTIWCFIDIIPGRS